MTWTWQIVLYVLRSGKEVLLCVSPVVEVRLIGVGNGAVNPALTLCNRRAPSVHGVNQNPGEVPVLRWRNMARIGTFTSSSFRLQPPPTLFRRFHPPFAVAFQEVTGDDREAEELVKIAPLPVELRAFPVLWNVSPHEVQMSVSLIAICWLVKLLLLLLLLRLLLLLFLLTSHLTN